MNDGTTEITGTCPECGKISGSMSIGRQHWAYCDEHKIAWCWGDNILSGWREETEADWAPRREKLKGYRINNAGWLTLASEAVNTALADGTIKPPAQASEWLLPAGLKEEDAAAYYATQNANAAFIEEALAGKASPADDGTIEPPEEITPAMMAQAIIEGREAFVAALTAIGKAHLIADATPEQLDRVVKTVWDGMRRESNKLELEELVRRQPAPKP